MEYGAQKFGIFRRALWESPSGTTLTARQCPILFEPFPKFSDICPKLSRDERPKLLFAKTILFAYSPILQQCSQYYQECLHNSPKVRIQI